MIPSKHPIPHSIPIKILNPQTGHPLSILKKWSIFFQKPKDVEVKKTGNSTPNGSRNNCNSAGALFIPSLGYVEFTWPFHLKVAFCDLTYVLGQFVKILNLNVSAILGRIPLLFTAFWDDLGSGRYKLPTFLPQNHETWRVLGPKYMGYNKYPPKNEGNRDSHGSWGSSWNSFVLSFTWNLLGSWVVEWWITQFHTWRNFHHLETDGLEDLGGGGAFFFLGGEPSRGFCYFCWIFLNIWKKPELRGLLFRPFFFGCWTFPLSSPNAPAAT